MIQQARKESALADLLESPIEFGGGTGRHPLSHGDSFPVLPVDDGQILFLGCDLLLHLGGKQRLGAWTRLLEPVQCHPEEAGSFQAKPVDANGTDQFPPCTADGCHSCH